MRRFLVLMSCLLMFGGASAFAQSAPVYSVTTTPTKVIYDGRSEAIGSVRITATATVGNNFASSIEFTFNNVACDLTTSLPVAAIPTTNVTAAGPQLIYHIAVGGTALINSTITSISNSTGSCVVDVSVPAGLGVGQGSYLELQGVRGRVDLSPGAFVQGANLTAALTSTPSTSSLFTIPNSGVVAVSQKPWDFTSADAGSILFCPAPVTNPDINFTEDFNGAFVQYADASGDLGPGFVVPADHRPYFGAINNTQLFIQVTGMPTGTTLTWNHQSTAMALNGGGLSKFTLISQSASGDTALYEYSTQSQNNADLTLESYTIGATFHTVGTVPGTATVQAWLNPPLASTDTNSVTQGPYASGSVASPRFNDPPQPSTAATFFTVSPCHTNLLFPWMAFIPSANYDTGFAIANTSMDPYGTAPQNGEGCVLNFYPTDDTTLGGTPSPLTPIQVMTPNINGGGTYATNLSNIPAINTADFTGYMIAVCGFQYGHAFAFLTHDVITGAPDAVAQGYTALVIPDPALIGNFLTPGRVASPSLFEQILLPNQGEGLTQ